MTSTRFATVRDLYQAFPVAQDDVGAEPSDEPTLEFLRELVAKENWDAAVSYCAYLLPRREAVWWGCQSLRMMQPHRAPQDNAAIEVAESWVREPEEPRRREALNLGSQGDTRSPATWMAIAAGWSGGSIVRYRAAATASDGTCYSRRTADGHVPPVDRRHLQSDAAMHRRRHQTRSRFAGLKAAR
jgi:hypothetical protein